jgi:beta-lactamase class A
VGKPPAQASEVHKFNTLVKTVFGMKTFLVVLLSIVVPIASFSQKEDKKLKKELTQLINGFQGKVGIYVRHLKTGQMVAINADSIFPTASMIKVPISIGVFNKIEKGELDYHAEVIYKDSLLYEGVDLLGSFRDGEKIELSKLLMLMITMSDNTASLWCQYMAGTGTMINQWLADAGFTNTRVNSRTPGREGDKARFGWGQTTPREMAELVVRIREGKVISPRASERIYRNMTHIYFDTQALSEIPPYVQVASKQGAVDESRSEVLLVNAPHGDYVFCVITNNQKDQSWTRDNEGYVLLKKVSALLWKYFEPSDKWGPAKKIDEWH